MNVEARFKILKTIIPRQDSWASAPIHDEPLLFFLKNTLTLDPNS
jgi:hypothetical protein